MISEKTIELNLTLEWVNYLSNYFNRPCYAWGPSLQQEARWGFDAAIGRSGRFSYIQFKRAKPERGGLKYELNRTKNRDQHRLLCELEQLGFVVYYGLPLFTTIQHIAANRRSLLTPLHTAWYPPRRITMPGGGVGHHDLHVHSGRWFVTSTPKDISPPDDFSKLLDQLLKSKHIELTEEVVKTINAKFDKAARNSQLEERSGKSDSASDDITNGAAILFLEP